MPVQRKGKPSRKFATVLWKFRPLTAKQHKALALQKKRLQTTKTSTFGRTLRARQLVATLYGALSLQSLRMLLATSAAYPGKSTQTFFTCLEKRVDAGLVALHYAPTFRAARQLIAHGKVTVNGRLVQAPGLALQPGDVLGLAPEAREPVRAALRTLVERSAAEGALLYKPLQFEVNYKTLEAIFLFAPQQIHYPTQLEPELVLLSFR